jgi:hypothetical protein
MPIVVNATLLSVISSFYFFLLKSYREPLKKLIITTVIIAHTVANSLKYFVIFKDLLKDFYLFIAAVFAREER